MQEINIDHNEVERLKQLRRDLWDYKRVDHIPIFFWTDWSFGYTLHEQLKRYEVQFEVNSRTIEKSLKIIPDDYIPWARVTPGYMTIATAFGMEPKWGPDPEQPPGTEGYVIDDLSQVYELTNPGILAGLMPDNIKRIRYHTKNLPSDVYISGVDLGGPLNSCKDLLETNLLYTSFYDDPEAMHYLLNLVTDVQLEQYHAIIDAVGGVNRMTTIDFDPNWVPEKYKSFVSDDICATIGPDIFKEFSIPYNNRLFKPWGNGLLHNCGPNPSKYHYLDHNPKLKGLSVSFKYSHKDFPEFKEIFAEWGILHVIIDNEPTPELMLNAFNYTMETLSPDVVAIPMLLIDDTWHNNDVTALYWEMRKISEEYAANIKWMEN